MIVKLNGEVLDVTLENEKTALDVVDSLSRELNKKEIIMTSISINNTQYNVEDKKMKDIKISQIDEINIEASTKDELVGSLLEECRKVLMNIASDIKKNEFAHVKEFNELFLWIKETIETINRLSLFNLVEVKLLISTIDQLTAYLNSKEKDDSKIGSIISILESLIKYIDAIHLKISTNFSITSGELMDAIQESILILPEISEAFQVGHDKDAYDKINKIISILEICCIYLRKNISSFSADEKDEIEGLYEEINSLLTQIVEAFENGDAVLLGDLLEYELPEKLENYKRIILKG